MKRFLINSILLSLSLLFFVAHPYAAEQEKQLVGNIPSFSLVPYPEEGFCAGTLVRVPDGYKSIETIVEHDVVLGDNLQPKRVLRIAKRITQRSVCLKINETKMYAGYDQALQLPYNMRWEKAGNLVERDYLLDARGQLQHIECNEVIPEIVTLYQLVVEDHMFCIGPTEIIVHNADVAAASTAVLFLEYVAYAHPVIALIGSTVALSTVAYKAYEAYKQRRHSADTHDDEIPQELFLVERFYYEQRKQELTKLKDEFGAIYHGIITVKELFHPTVTTFSSQFLQSTLNCHTSASLLHISMADELKLSDECKMALRHAREHDFELLEKEIIELHAALVVHFNELLMQTDLAYDAYKDASSAIENAITLWNNNRHATTDYIASQTYEHDILEECLILDIQQKLSELEKVVSYYLHCKQIISLRQSTTIFEQLSERHNAIATEKQWTREQLLRIAHNIQIVEHYFTQRGIPTTAFKNQVKNAFHEEKANKNAQALKKAQEKLLSVGNGGPGKDNDPKKPRNDDDFANMYEVFKRAAIGKALKDAVEGTHFSYKGVSKIFKVIKDIAEYGIKKGDWLYLDKMHGDHIEVFKKCGKAVRTILNMDGTVNITKVAAAT